MFVACRLRKVTLQAKNEAELRSVSAKLTTSSVDHVLWVRAGSFANCATTVDSTTCIVANCAD